MPILVTCPQCEKRLKLRDGFPGGKLSCPVCSKVFRVPPPKERAARPAAAVAPAELPVVDLPDDAVIEPDRVPKRTRSATRPAYDDERPRRRRRKYDEDDDDELVERVRRRGANLWLMIGLPAGVVVLLAVVFIVVIALGRRETRPVAQAQQPEQVRAAAEGEAAVRPPDQAKPGQPVQQAKGARPLAKRAAAPAPKVDRVLNVALQANDFVYDPTRGLIYAAIGNTAPKHGNTVAAIDPATGDVRWTVDVGSDPILLDISEDGQALWVAFGGAAALQRVDLERRAAGPLMPLSADGFGGAFAEKIQILPGTVDTVVVSLAKRGISPRHAGVAVYDNGVQRVTKTRDHTGSNRIAATDEPNVLIGYNNETTEFGLRRLLVDDNGIQQGEVRGGVIQGFRADIIHAGGRIYSTTGAVVDARTLTLVGTLPAQGAVAVDVPRKRAYVLAYDRRVIEACDTDRLVRVAGFALPQGELKGGLITIADTALAYRGGPGIVIVPVSELRAP